MLSDGEERKDRKRVHLGQESPLPKSYLTYEKQTLQPDSDYEAHSSPLRNQDHNLTLTNCARSPARDTALQRRKRNIKCLLVQARELSRLRKQSSKSRQSSRSSRKRSGSKIGFAPLRFIPSERFLKASMTQSVSS